jgi:pimeloyl-ACP methyl ester carboxylesterase
VLCGLSLGGYIAFDFVRRFRDRLAGLILVSTQARADPPEARAGRDQAIELVRRSGPSSIAEVMVPRLFAPEAASRIPETMAMVRDRISYMDPAGIVQALEALRDRPDSDGLLPAMGGIPTLVLAGAADRAIAQPVMQQMAEGIPGSIYQVIEDAGHLTSLEQPEAVTAAIAAFLARIPA